MRLFIHEKALAFLVTFFQFFTAQTRGSSLKMDTVNQKTKLKCPISIKWRIPKDRLLKLKDELGEYLSSTSFVVSNVPDVKYWIEIYPNDDDAEGETVIYLFLNCDGEMEIEADYNFTIASANVSIAKNCMRFSEMDYSRAKLCTTEELFDPEKRFFVDGEMTIKMDGILMIEKEDDNKVFNRDTFDDPLWLNLWNQEEAKDITIYADGKSIATHKCVLAARSPVFAKMFESGMKEAKENKVVIEDFPFEIVAKAIKLCYHQSLVPHSTLEDKMKLLQFFDKYDIRSFKADLEKYLISVLNELTVCRLTNAALISNARELEKKCTDFLQDCMKTKPIADFDLLDKEFAMNLFKNTFCYEAQIDE